MLPIGLIGAGAEWDAVWCPAFSLVSRLVVKSFYDPIGVRGERVAESHDWPGASGVRQLLMPPRLKGVVVLDAGWLGNWVVQQADQQRIPVLVSPRESSVELLGQAFHNATGETLIQPELRRRYTPATMRVRELTATRLGAIRSLSIELPSASPLTVSQWAEAIDWCRFVVQSGVIRSEFFPEQQVLRVAFRKQYDEKPVEAALSWSRTEAPPLYPADFSAELICQNGVAIVTGGRRVRWKAEEDEGDEELSDDRSSAMVQLDLFARRLAGGLVPVPSLEDVAVAVNAARTAIG
ncbi:hypothetical protein Pan44_44470 [Caulifigura coniformis]|uniref:Gfo/Idh/MocA-like oxidoreductase N-terminal domain-containing protein n=1 Tax=Caulifigura coniformis TaxID=2527983 RepID=A0A517SJT6_9PLAN|nr:hypothetical protein [Caulifigura coniformis]QDT56393.1 hypothetical protein Pan44_44470 [Caulifigura coniformis]